MRNSRLSMGAAPAPRNSTIHATEQPLKISIVFDDEVSVSSAEVLIRRVASDFPCDTQSFDFQELALPGPAVAAARSASDTDILVLAVRDDQTTGIFPAPPKWHPLGIEAWRPCYWMEQGSRPARLIS